MKSFFNEKSSMISKLFVYQIAMSLLGVFVVSPFADTSMCLIAGIFSMLFYFSLVVYAVIEDGQKDYISVTAGRKQGSVFSGLKYAIVSYIPTIIITVSYMIARLVSADSFISGAKLIVNVIVRFFLMGMYLGIDVSLRAESSPEIFKFISENGIFYCLYLIVMPAVVAISYALSYKGKIHINTEPKSKK